MGAPPKPGVDWIAIEGAYRAGVRTLRSIGSDYGISEAAVRKRARNLGWTRDPEGAKREIVKARLAVRSSDPTQNALRTISDEADADVRDMETATRTFRNILRAMEVASAEVTDPRDAKVIAEATEKATSGIRLIRGLDDPEAERMPEPLVVQVQNNAIGSVQPEQKSANF